MTLVVDSSPAGALVYHARSRSVLGRAPAALAVPRSSEATELVLRFADGTESQLGVVPDRATHVLVEHPGAAGEASGPREGP